MSAMTFRRSSRVSIRTAISAVTTREAAFQRDVRKVRDRDPAGDAAGGGRNFEQHSKAEIDQVAAGLAGRDGARRGNHRHEADRSGGFEVEPNQAFRKGTRKTPPPSPSKRAETSGNRARRHHDRDY